MTTPAQVYYFPLNDEMEEGAAIPVSLVEEGGKLVADISALPSAMQSTLRRFGLPDAFHRESVFPTDGPAFLEATLRETNAYRRFRTKMA